jgi:hypothetical protein
MGKHVCKDLTGMRFGQLLVVRRVANRTFGTNCKKTVRAMWLCQCDCGNTSEVVGYALLRPSCTKSCGCSKYETRINPPGVTLKNRILNSYKIGASRRDLEWAISDDLFESLIFSNCHYCDLPPARVTRRATQYRKDSICYNGIDRVNNTLGYILGNVVTCCKDCNKAKDVMSAEQFVKWAVRVANHAGKRDELL